MEPIIVKSKVNFITYYKISLLASLKRIGWMAITVLVIFGAIITFIDKAFIWDDYKWLLAWILFSYGILTPILLWFACKRAMKASPILAEGATYTISEDHIEGVTPSSSSKTSWKYIKKAVEKDACFLMYTNMRSVYFLPKDGFTSTGDMEKFKEIVKANNIRAYFK